MPTSHPDNSTSQLSKTLTKSTIRLLTSLSTELLNLANPFKNLVLFQSSSPLSAVPHHPDCISPAQYIDHRKNLVKNVTPILADLRRVLDRDEKSVGAVRALLCSWNVVGKSLLPIALALAETCENDVEVPGTQDQQHYQDKESKQREAVYNAIYELTKVLVLLTQMPVVDLNQGDLNDEEQDQNHDMPKCALVVSTYEQNLLAIKEIFTACARAFLPFSYLIQHYFEQRGSCLDPETGKLLSSVSVSLEIKIQRTILWFRNILQPIGFNGNFQHSTETINKASIIQHQLISNIYESDFFLSIVALTSTTTLVDTLPPQTLFLIMEIFATVFKYSDMPSISRQMLNESLNADQPAKFSNISNFSSSALAEYRALQSSAKHVRNSQWAAINSASFKVPDSRKGSLAYSALKTKIVSASELPALAGTHAKQIQHYRVLLAMSPKYIALKKEKRSIRPPKALRKIVAKAGETAGIASGRTIGAKINFVTQRKDQNLILDHITLIAEQIIQNCLVPIMVKVHELLVFDGLTNQQERAESLELMRNDQIVFLSLMSFFIAFYRARMSPKLAAQYASKPQPATDICCLPLENSQCITGWNYSIDPIACLLFPNHAYFVIDFASMAIEDKRWADLETAVIALKEILVMLSEMLLSDIAEIRRDAQRLQEDIFSREKFLRLIHFLAKDYDHGHLSFRHFTNVVEILEITIDLLSGAGEEVYLTKMKKVRRRSKKKKVNSRELENSEQELAIVAGSSTIPPDGESEEEQVEEEFVEADLDTETELAQFVQARIIQNLGIVIRTALSNVQKEFLPFLSQDIDNSLSYEIRSLSTPELARSAIKIYKQLWQITKVQRKNYLRAQFFELSVLILCSTAFALDEYREKITTTSMLDTFILLCKDISEEIIEFVFAFPSAAADMLIFMEKGTCHEYKGTENQIDKFCAGKDLDVDNDSDPEALMSNKQIENVRKSSYRVEEYDSEGDLDLDQFQLRDVTENQNELFSKIKNKKTQRKATTNVNGTEPEISAQKGSRKRSSKRKLGLNNSFSNEDDENQKESQVDVVSGELTKKTLKRKQIEKSPPGNRVIGNTVSVLVSPVASWEDHDQDNFRTIEEEENENNSDQVTERLISPQTVPDLLSLDDCRSETKATTKLFSDKPSLYSVPSPETTKPTKRMKCLYGDSIDISDEDAISIDLEEELLGKAFAVIDSSPRNDAADLPLRSQKKRRARHVISDEEDNDDE